MSTRSYIGIENSDKTVAAVYCHSDGYPSYNGRILLENYDTAEKVNELLSFGGISTLGKSIGTKHDFEKRPSNECTFYFRDRNEYRSKHPKIYLSVEEFKELCNENYTYLFSNGEWLFRSESDFFKKLTLEECKND